MALNRFGPRLISNVRSLVRFEDKYTNRALRYSIGLEAESGKFYLSIPVSNTLVDYEEYYEISLEEFHAYPQNAAFLGEFAGRCRQHLADEKLLVQPGTDRGVG